MSDKMFKRMRRKVREERFTGESREQHYKTLKRLYRAGYKFTLVFYDDRQGPTVWERL